MKYAPIDSLVSAIRIPDPSDRAAWGEFVAWCLDEGVEIKHGAPWVSEDNDEEGRPQGHPGEVGYFLRFVLDDYELVPGNYLTPYRSSGSPPDWEQIDADTFAAKYVLTVPGPPFVREPIVEDPFAAPASFRSIPDKYHTFNADYREPPTDGLGVEGGFFTPPSALVPATDEADPF